MMKPFALAAGIAASMAPMSALAWGRTGHAIVMEIAWRDMSAHSRQVFNAEVGSRWSDAADLASYADEMAHRVGRRDPIWSENLHFTDIPLDAGFDEGRDCRNRLCAVDAVADDAPLAAHDVNRLVMLVHVVGDLHQPLHSSNDGDGGGNGYRVDHGRNLHALWDSVMLKDAGITDDPSLVTRIAALAPAESLSSCAAAGPAAREWANEAHAIARGIYPADHHIDRVYEDRFDPILLRQLSRAGHRLGAVLNACL